MLNKIYKILFIPILIFIPFITSAQIPLGKTTTFFGNLLNLIQSILIPLAFSLALLFFFWGVAKYIWKAGSEKEEGKKIMIWGLVALFVMASVWGIVYFIQTEIIGGPGPTNMPIPTIGGPTIP